MNLTTLVERACLEAGYNDADDLTAGKKFARHWDEHIHNSALWKDALTTNTVAIDPTNNLDHAEGIVYLPEIVDRIVAARTDVNTLRIVNEEDYYRLDFDALAATGTPSEFAIRPPAWFKWRPTAGITGIIPTGAAGDTTQPLRLIYQDGAGYRRTADTTVGAAATITPPDGVSLTFLAAFKATTTAAVTLIGNNGSAVGPNLVTGTYNGANKISFLVTLGATYEYIAGNETSAAYFSGTVITPGTFVATDPLAIGSTTLVVLTKTAGAGIAGTAVFRIAAVTATTFGTLAATDTKSPSYTRMRLLPIPNKTFTLSVLAKTKYQDLDFDQQEPALRNLNNCLMAFIRASMKRRGGENGAAMAEFAEANALLTKTQQIEALQAANNQRFLPEVGMGPEWGIGPHSAYFGS